MPERCYICGDILIDVPSGHNGPLLPKHRTRDHVPPQGIFLSPKPSNLICVPCCNQCNSEQSGSDECLRMFAAMEISRNAAGNKILIERVFGSTMAKARQPSFFLSVATSLRDATVNTPDGAREVSVFTVHSNAIIPSVIRITKGLLAHLYPAYDYRADEFTVWDIHSATLLGNDREIQLQMMREIVTKTQVRGLGNHDEFKFWRQVESCRGVWLLVFYDAVAFVVSHNRPAGNSKRTDASAS